MKNHYIFGIIGAGMIAREHIKNLNKFDNVQIKWLCSTGRNKNKIQEILKEYNITAATTNYSEVLDDKEVDAIIICTPPSLHKEIFLEAVNKGKHILLEKPAATNSHDLEEMLDAAEKHPELKICDCSCRHSRLQPKFNFIKNIIDSGKLGEIYYIHHNEGLRQGRPGIEYHPSAKWFLNSAIAGGGLVLDWGVYDLSFHLGLLNDQPELNMITTSLAGKLDDKNPGTDIYDTEEHAISMMSFKNGLRYYWERAAHSNVEVANETRIYGTRGGLKFSFLSWNSPEVILYGLDKESNATEEKLTISMDNYPGDGFMLINHFMNVLEGKETPAMPLKLAAKHLGIIFQAYENSNEITSFK